MRESYYHVTAILNNPIFILFAAAAILQISILFILLISLGRRDTRHNQPTPVSVVIASRNNGNKLTKLVEKLLSQNHKEFEILIVNDRSSDETESYLRNLSLAENRVKVVNVDHKPEKMDGKKYALTLGIKAAKYENIVFTDADCLPESSDWLNSMSSGFNQKNTDIVLGVSLYKKSTGLLGALIQFESLWTAVQYIGFARLGMPYMGVGRNLGYKKSLFLKNKGFSGYMNVTGGDDDLFVNKHSNGKNTSVVIGSDSLIWTEPKTNWGDFLVQKTRHLAAGKKYKFIHKFILGLITISHLLFWTSLITLLLFSPLNAIVLSLFFTRTMLLYLTFSRGSNRFGVPFSLWGLLFLDFIFLFYYLSTGLRAIFTKKVRWS